MIAIANSKPKITAKKQKSIAHAELMAAMEEQKNLDIYLNVFELMIFYDAGRALPKERLIEVMPKFHKVANIMKEIAKHLENVHRYTCTTAGIMPEIELKEL